MSLTNQLDELFKVWEETIKDYKDIFVKDGIINEEEWLQTKPKILFIAKEANHYGNAMAGDFRDEWKNTNSKYPFAYRIAEWSYGLINDFPVFNKIFDNSLLYPETLQKIAFLNIKKTGGVGTSSGLEIGNHFTQNQYFLEKQIEIINPDLIILCLSFNVFIRTGLFKDSIWDDSGYDIKIAKWKNAKLIDFYHPSSRNVPAASYSLLQNVCQSEVFKYI